MFSSELWLAKSSSGFYNNVATQSARFNSGSSSYLSFTPSGNGDRRKATLSFWFKKTTNGETYPTMFCCNDSSGGHYMTITFYEDSLYFQTAPSADGLITTAKYRDTTAWYHCCWAIDTTQSTASNRVKCYINGTQITDFSTEQYPDQDSYLDICSTVAHAWGHFVDYGRYFNGYIADAYIIDGQQLTPSSFTETKEGALIPKAYEGSYGTNGVHLEFKQTGTGTASTSTIGADTSGNTHHYTSSGMGSDDSNIPDSPENNFATLGGLEKLQDFTLSEGNLKYTTSTNQRGLIASTAIPNTGKHYFECRVLSLGASQDDVYIGVCEPDKMRSNLTGTRGGATVSGAGGYTFNNYNGYAVLDGSNQSADSIGHQRSMPQIMGVAVDRDNNNIKFTWDGSSYSSTYSIPANVPLYVYVGSGGGTSTAEGVFNFGQDSTFLGAISAGGNADGNSNGDFALAVPTGYLALCSANLSEPTLSPAQDEQATDHFQVYTFTGDANSTRTISGLNFQPDLLWSKARNQAFSHNLYDSSRGNDKAIQSNNSNAENTYDLFNGFTSDGYNTTTDGSAGDLLNYNGGTYVNFLWKANAGTTTTNDASATSVGTIDSVYQANTTAGFSIVTYTGTGSAGSIAHGLGGVPEVMIIKNRSEAHSWSGTYHHKMASDPHTDYLNLSGSGAVVDDNTQWNDTAPTSTVFTVGTANNTNKSSNNYVGYFFRGIEGFSKFGSLTANGSADGTYCHIGFQPSLVIVKQSSATGDWNMIDTTRQGHNHANGLPVVRANSSAVEEQASGNQGQIDILSNGFKFRSAHSSFNTSGATVVYMAFAEIPEKYSNAF